MNAMPPKPSSDRKAKKQNTFFGRMRRASGKLGGAPLPSVGTEEIAAGARLIGGLASLLRHGPGADNRMRTGDDGQIDLGATAFLYGISVEELVSRIHRRRGDTARAAYIFFGLGSLLFVLWLWEALSLRTDAARVLSATEYLPFWLVFYLLSFKSAWMNWQLRLRRLGSPVEYLRTTGRFLPG